jgi:hypothetical protein
VCCWRWSRLSLRRPWSSGSSLPRHLPSGPSIFGRRGGWAAKAFIATSGQPGSMHSLLARGETHLQELVPERELRILGHHHRGAPSRLDMSRVRGLCSRAGEMRATDPDQPCVARWLQSGLLGALPGGLGRDRSQPRQSLKASAAVTELPGKAGSGGRGRTSAAPGVSRGGARENTAPPTTSSRLYYPVLQARSQQNPVLSAGGVKKTAGWISCPVGGHQIPSRGAVMSVSHIWRGPHPDMGSSLYPAVYRACSLKRPAPGVHPKVVQERLGHATIAITLDTYSHVTPALAEDAAATIAARIAPE